MAVLSPPYFQRRATPNQRDIPLFYFNRLAIRGGDATRENHHPAITNIRHFTGGIALIAAIHKFNPADRYPPWSFNGNLLLSINLPLPFFIGHARGKPARGLIHPPLQIS
ncbi:MAG: hypothetical protein IPP67_03595 [Rhodospirillaceae bacterium]|nr:hypothetical protein [Rhodospirillaceae bacterium]